jgi:MscS family membrane protein
MRNVLDGINSLLAQHRLVELDSIRVRFIRFGASSLDVQVLAYVLADDWNAFLEIQQALLLQIMDVVQAAGTQLAIQSHAMYLVVDSVSQGTRAQALLTPAPSDKLVDEDAAVNSV